jgi:hypothetical protein
MSCCKANNITDATLHTGGKLFLLHFVKYRACQKGLWMGLKVLDLSKIYAFYVQNSYRSLRKIVFAYLL